VLNLVPKKDLGSALYGYGYSSYTSHHYSSHERHAADAREPGASPALAQKG
jgi:hypothetical protein